MGVGATPTVREGGGERGIAHWGRRWEVDNMSFPFTSRGELVGGLSPMSEWLIVTNVRGWRRRHLVLGHVALALAPV